MPRSVQLDFQANIRTLHALDAPVHVLLAGNRDSVVSQAGRLLKRKGACDIAMVTQFQRLAHPPVDRPSVLVIDLGCAPDAEKVLGYLELGWFVIGAAHVSSEATCSLFLALHYAPQLGRNRQSLELFLLGMRKRDAVNELAEKVAELLVKEFVREVPTELTA